LTRVKLKSPSMRDGEPVEKGSRLYERRRTTAKAPPGFYANPLTEIRAYVAKPDGTPSKRRIGTFDNLKKAKAFATKFANENGAAVVLVIE